MSFSAFSARLGRWIPVEIDIATALTVANAAPSDSGSAMLSVDWEEG